MYLFIHNISVLTANKVAFHSFSHLEQQPTTPAELSLFHLREEIYIVVLLPSSGSHYLPWSNKQGRLDGGNLTLGDHL